MPRWSSRCLAYSTFRSLTEHEVRPISGINNSVVMTKHDKIEHELPNGDILIVDATDIRPEVEQAFREVKAALDREVDEAYEQLRPPQAA